MSHLEPKVGKRTQQKTLKSKADSRRRSGFINHAIDAHEKCLKFSIRNIPGLFSLSYCAYAVAMHPTPCFAHAPRPTSSACTCRNAHSSQASALHQRAHLGETSAGGFYVRYSVLMRLPNIPMAGMCLQKHGLELFWASREEMGVRGTVTEVVEQYTKVLRSD